ncbi:hypothetical protein HA050_11865 [Iodobacter sp. HSC-16F04]|uniref:Uncharacterized protein n=1 Tax=Iodobacter violaceini TaxID=3044271 RepID=A0ABX0KQJ1_9NEIS|nr:hypothetical protein [Iodobacter violacea]NHQ86815.1 hypothetical protein [Iodobacter violacea]
MQRFRVFNDYADSKLVFSVPWAWLAIWLVKRFGRKDGYYRLVDGRNSKTLMEWVHSKEINLTDYEFELDQIHLGENGKSYLNSSGCLHYGKMYRSVDNLKFRNISMIKNNN